MLPFARLSAPLIALALVAGVASNRAHAEPKPRPAPAAVPTKAATPSDKIAQFLGERGLIPATTTEPSLVRQVRDRASDWTSDLVISAMNFLGVRYKRGGNTAEEGFDCSGFTRHVFESSIGLMLPRRASEQAKTANLQQVPIDQLKPGDLVFFNTLRAAFSHVGIYVGDGKFIHAPRTGAEVRVEDMRVAYWSKRFDGARRAATPKTPGAGEAPAAATEATMNASAVAATEPPGPSPAAAQPVQAEPTY